MITITWESVLWFLGLFTACCVAGGWLLKIIHALKKPSDDIKAKLEKEEGMIAEAEDDLAYLKSAVALLIKSNLVVLGHLSTNNNKGEMTKMKEEIKQFLINEATNG